MSSWAERARKAQNETPISQEPKVRVVAPLPPEAGKALPAQPLAATQVLPEFNKGLLVLDANAFIKGMDNALDIADALVTVPQVIKEVKDARARELLERLPIPLTLLDPTTESLREVMEKAKKTGDFGVLSRTDIRVAALALDCAKQTGSIKKEIDPRPAVVNPDDKRSGVTTIDGGTADDESDGEEATESEDSEGEWITPSNVKSVKAKELDGAAVEFAGGSACISSDFPIQNVLMHLGVTVIGPTGMQIRQLRSWLLRCHACFALVHDTTRQFCPDCGSGNTLKRVSYEVMEDGTKHLFINFKKIISKRGTVYALPKPRGGRRGTNKTLALREDQLAHVAGRRPGTKERRIEEPDDTAVFGGTMTKKRFDPDKPRTESSYRRYNPNEKKKQLAARRK